MLLRMTLAPTPGTMPGYHVREPRRRGGGMMVIMHQKAEMAQPEVRVRPAQASDVPSVIALDVETTGLEKAAYWKERFESYGGRHRDRFFLIATVNEEPAGFIVGEIRAWEFGSPPSGWIFAIDVKPSQRQHGIGSVLFDAMCARFRKAGVKHVRTMLAKEDTLVLSFFRSQGMMAGPFIELEMALPS
jgi:ribosomal protein S18 acetylase RimI-like enzyme